MLNNYLAVEWVFEFKFRQLKNLPYVYFSFLY